MPENMAALGGRCAAVTVHTGTNDRWRFTNGGGVVSAMQFAGCKHAMYHEHALSIALYSLHL
jgi:hypothetical protein